MRVALVLLVSLVLAGAASAAPPGFTESPLLEPAASFVAGKPVKVWCGFPKIGNRYVVGATNYAGANEIYLSAGLICGPLERLVLHQPVFTHDAGMGLFTLVHESEHASGIADESAADCAALKQIAEVGIRFFGLRGQRRYLRDLMREAWLEHRSGPASYSGTC